MNKASWYISPCELENTVTVPFSHNIDLSEARAEGLTFSQAKKAIERACLGVIALGDVRFFFDERTPFAEITGEIDCESNSDLCWVAETKNAVSEISKFMRYAKV